MIYVSRFMQPNTEETLTVQVVQSNTEIAEHSRSGFRNRFRHFTWPYFEPRKENRQFEGHEL